MDQKPGISMALPRHLVGNNRALKSRYATPYPRPHEGRDFIRSLGSSAACKIVISEQNRTVIYFFLA